MIRQAISCDICGAEKKQTNHWFVACEQAGELRVSGWSSRNRLRAGTKHLCGQTCLHKLLDEFLARAVEGRPAADAVAEMEQREMPDASLAAKAAFVEEPPARAATEAAERIAPAVAAVAERVAPVLAMPARIAGTPRPVALPTRIDESAQEAARRRRAEAWERERTRELRMGEGRPN